MILIKKHETNFKGVGQPLRVILTGSKFGPGLYDILTSLGKEEVEKRLSECRKVLMKVRDAREQPGLDDKVIAAWNGLMIVYAMLI